MPAKQESCSFTGHRPEKLPWHLDENDFRCKELKRRMMDALEGAYQAGYRHFLCGMARGCDLYFGECVLALRQQFPDVTLEAAIPCPTQADHWPPELKARYDTLLACCDLETMICAEYNAGCMQRRDRYMVDHASLLIAAFDGSPGGTQYTIQYAMRQGITVIDLSIPT